MNILKYFRGSSVSSQDLQYLKNITEQLNKDNKDLVGRQLGDLFVERSEQFIGELVIHPEQASTYQLLSQRLKSIDEKFYISFQSTIDSIQNIAKFLREGNTEGLNAYSKQISSQLIDQAFIQTVVSSFYNLHLPKDLEKIRTIANLDVRTRVMAQLINRDCVPLGTLNLEKDELKSIAPHLTYLDCTNPPMFVIELSDSNSKNQISESEQQVASDLFSDWKNYEIYDLLKSCKNIKTLIIHSQSLKWLPPLPYCEKLDCSNSINLNELPPLPECKILLCNDDCKFIIPSLPKCKVFECKNSRVQMLPRKADRKIAEFPVCEVFNCSGNKVIERLPSLPVCHSIDCSNTKIKWMPEVLPKCHTLNCSNCGWLAYLPRIPNCRFLNYAGCSRLTGESLLSLFIKNTIPLRFLNDNQVPEVLQVSIETLNVNPLNALLDLSFLLSGADLPPVQFIELDGTITPFDPYQGPIKNFITRLFDALILHANTKDQLFFLKNESGLMPAINPEMLELDFAKKGFQILGAIFIQCLKHQYLIGKVFNPSMFTMISSLTYQEVMSQPDSVAYFDLRIKLTVASLINEIPFAKILLEKNSFETLTDSEYCELRDGILFTLGDDRPELSEVNLENKKWVYQEAIRFLMNLDQEKSKNGDAPLAVFIIARQMATLCRSEEIWKAACQFGPKVMEESIEGVLTSELFLKTIQWHKTQNVLESEVMNIRQFVEDFIKGIDLKGDNAAEMIEERLVNFTFAITSSKTLTNTSVLNFHVLDRNAESLPSVHVCFATIEIPSKYSNFEVFVKRMNVLIQQSIDQSHSGFVM